MNIPIILGTNREGRQSEKVAKFMLGEVIKYGFDSEIIDVKDYPLTHTDRNKSTDDLKKLSEKLVKADGFIIVTPEYNHSFPGELKLLLDSFYHQEYQRKPVGVCGVSAGPIGGARAVEQLKTVCIEFKMVNIRESMYFMGVQNLFDELGQIKDQAYQERVKVFLDEFSWYAKALSEARNKN